MCVSFERERESLVFFNSKLNNSEINACENSEKVFY